MVQRQQVFALALVVVCAESTAHAKLSGALKLWASEHGKLKRGKGELSDIVMPQGLTWSKTETVDTAYEALSPHNSPSPLPLPLDIGDWGPTINSRPQQQGPGLLLAGQSFR